MKLVTQIILNMIGVIVRVFFLGGCINSLENQMVKKIEVPVHHSIDFNDEGKINNGSFLLESIVT